METRPGLNRQMEICPSWIPLRKQVDVVPKLNCYRNAAVSMWLMERRVRGPLGG